MIPVGVTVASSLPVLAGGHMGLKQHVIHWPELKGTLKWVTGLKQSTEFGAVKTTFRKHYCTLKIKVLSKDTFNILYERHWEATELRFCVFTRLITLFFTQSTHAFALNPFSATKSTRNQYILHSTFSSEL